MDHSDIWKTMQLVMPSFEDMQYREMSMDEFTMSQCNGRLKSIHNLATDSVPDSPERIADWKNYLNGKWWTTHLPFCVKTRWEGTILNMLGETFLAFGNVEIAKEFFIKSIQTSYRGDGIGAYKALQNLVTMGYDNPFVVASFIIQ